MDPWTLSWDEIAPLFQDTWRGSEDALAVLGNEQLFGLLIRLATHAYNSRRSCREHFTEPLDLALDVIDLCARRLTQSRGMPRPSRWDHRPSPEGTLFNYLDSRIKDVCRRRKMERAPKLSLDEAGPQGQRALGERLPDPQARHPDDALHNRRRRAILEQTLAEAGRTCQPQHLLAWLCLNLPERVEPGHVDRAERSLVRSPSDTWTRLSPWLTTVLDPQRPAERRFLAWVLRSDHPGPPDAWAAAHPMTAKTARDTLTTWAKRARLDLKKRAEALGAST